MRCIQIVYFFLLVLILCPTALVAQAPSLTTTGSTANNTTICSGGTVNLAVQGANLTAGSVKWFRHTVANPSNILTGVEICERIVPVPPPTNGDLKILYNFNTITGCNNQTPTVTPTGYATGSTLTMQNSSPGYCQSTVQNPCDQAPASGSVFGGPFLGGSFGSPSNYYQFTVALTPPADCSVDISSIAFETSCSVNGARGYKVTYNHNGAGEVLLGSGTIDTCSNSNGDPYATFCFPFSAAFGAITSGSVVFRIYGWGASTTSGKMRLENLKVEGTYMCQPKFTSPLPPNCTDNPDCNGASSQSYYYFATFIPTSTGIPTATAPSIKVNVNCPTVVAGNNGPRCIGTTATLNSTASGLGPWTYSWTGPNGYTSSQQNPTITNLNNGQFGDYTVVVTGAGGCTNSATTTLALSTGFTVDIFSQGIPLPADITLCQGINTTLTATPNGGTPPFTYAWSTGATTQTITVSPTSNVTYKVVVTDATGCTAEKSVNVTVVAIPANLAPTVTSNSPVCEGDEIKLIYVSFPTIPQFILDLLPIEYKWSGPLGFTGLGKTVTIPDAKVNMSGVYKLILELQGCQSKEGSVTVTVKPAPKIFNPGEKKKCGDENGNATFNLTSYNPVVSGGVGVVTWFTDPAGTMPLSPATAHVVNISANPTKVYAKVTNNGCSSPLQEVTLIVLPFPNIVNGIEDEKCKVIGGLTVFNLVPLAKLVNGGSNDIVKWYTDPAGNSAINGTTHGVNATTNIYATVTNPEGCVAGPVPVKLIVNPLPDVTISPASPSYCAGDSVVLLANVANGSPDYTFVWKLPNNNLVKDSNSIFAKSPGNYIVSVTDAKGCVRSVSKAVTEMASPKTVITPLSSILCKDSMVNISLTVTGGSPGYKYNWKTPDSSFVGSNAYVATNQGTYSITVSDQNNCRSIVATNIKVNEKPDARFDSLSSNVCVGSAFSTPISFTGKAPFAFTYQIGNQAIQSVTTANNPFLLTGAPSGNVSIKLLTVTDSNNCSSILNDSILIFVNTPVVITGLQDTCINNGSYIVLFNILPGIPNSPVVTGPIGGTLSNNQFTSNPIPVNTPYSFTISNGGECPPVVISGIKKICSCDTKSGDMNLSPINLCAGDTASAIYIGGYQSDGNDTLEFVLHDGTGKALGNVFAKSFKPFFDLNVINGIVKGTVYYISAIAGNKIGNVVDVNDLCFKISLGTPIQINEKPTAVLSGNSTICYGDTSILKIAITGTPPFVLKYEVGGNIETVNLATNVFEIFASPATSAVYNLISIKDKFCASVLSQKFDLTVIQPKSGSFEPTVCVGETYSYHGIVFDALKNSQSITIKNGASTGCDSVIAFKLNFFAPVVNQVDRTLCFGQTLTFNNTVYSEMKPSGVEVLAKGSANGCDSTIIINLAFTNAVINAVRPVLCLGENFSINGKVYDQTKLVGSDTLKAGSYSGCDSIIDVSLTYLPAAIGNFTTSLCIGSTIKVGSTTFSAANSSGQVVLPNASAKGCDSTVNVVVNFYPRSTGNFVKTLCSGEKITLSGKTFSELNPVDSVVVFNGSKNGCDSTLFVALNYLQPVTNNFTQVLCPNANVLINGNIYGAAGKLTGVETISNGAKNGCDSIINVNLSFYPVASSSINPTLCQGSSVVVNGKTYNEQNPKGVELLVAAAKNGCDSIITVDLKFKNPAVNSIQSTICRDASIVANGKTYNFAKPFGRDTIKSGAFNGCDSIIDINLSFYPKDTFFLKQQLCIGQIVTVNNVVYNENKTKGIEILKNQSKFGCDSVVSIDLSYSSPSTFTIRDTVCKGDSRLVNGKVYDELTPAGVEVIKNGNSKGCDSTIAVNLLFRPEVTGSILGNITLCKGKSADLSLLLTGAAKYDVVIASSSGPDIVLNNVNGNQTFKVSPSATTQYTIKSIKISGLQPCKTTISGAVVVNVDDLSVAVSANDFNGYQVSCPGSKDGSASITTNNPTSPLTIKWSNGATGLVNAGLAAGTYYVTISSIGGCTTTDSVLIKEPTPIDLLGQVKSPICYDGKEGEISIDLPVGGSKPLSFSLDNKLFFPAQGYPYIFNHKSAGKYTIYVKDANGCKTSKTFTVPNPKLLTLDLGQDTTIHFGDSIQLKPVANFNIKTLIWDPTKYLSCDSCLNPFAKPIAEFIGFKLIAVDSLGCRVEDDIVIKTEKNKGVYIPNMFTPDGDTFNDIFYLFGSEDVEKVDAFMVFDRWGDQLYRALNFLPNDPTYGWDGTFQSKNMLPGVYVYYAVVSFKDGSKQTFKGDVTLIR